MAFFKDTAGTTREPVPPVRDALQREPERSPAPEIPRRVVEAPEPRPAVRTEPKESVIAADLTIEGKIEGTGHVRIAGRFKGDVQVQGNLTIENGAHLAGQVRAKQVIVAGELQGNIDGAGRVEVLETGVLIGDVKAGSVSVAAGSRMRGQIEFGWGEKGAPKADTPRGSGSGV
jgi:cytoskeletal protein CcmA (bactofilin family)